MNRYLKGYVTWIAVERLRQTLPLTLWQPLRRLAWRWLWFATWCEQYLQRGFLRWAPSLNRSERATLIETICDGPLFDSLLEIGCGHGQNFYQLGQLLPDKQLVGIDKDPERVRLSNEYLVSTGISSSRIEWGDGTELSRFGDCSFDLVICCAVLLYFPPLEMEQGAKEMLRVARKRIVLVEQHKEGEVGEDIKCLWLKSDPSNPEKVVESSYWIRDYQRLFSRLAPAARTTVSRIANPVWVTEGWQEYGSLVVVDLIL